MGDLCADVYTAALAVLDSVESINFYQGHIHPEDASHIARLIAEEVQATVGGNQ